MKPLSLQELREKNPRIIVASDGEDKLPYPVVGDVISLHFKEINEASALSIDSLCRAIEAELSSMPAMENVKVSSLDDSADIFIRYRLRSPIAIVASKEEARIAIDKEGVMFYLSPLYTPKNLPLLILPEGDSQYEISEDSSKKNSLSMKVVHVVEKVRKIFNASPCGVSIYSFQQEVLDRKKSESAVFYIQKIDLSKLDHYSPFQREVIITLEASRMNPGISDTLFFRLHPDLLETLGHLDDRKVSLKPFLRLAFLKKAPDEKSGGEQRAIKKARTSIFDFRFKDFCLFHQFDGVEAQ